MKHNRPVLQKWAYRLSRALLAVLWLAHATGCLLPGAAVKDEDSDPFPWMPDAGGKKDSETSKPPVGDVIRGSPDGSIVHVDAGLQTRDGGVVKVDAGRKACGTMTSEACAVQLFTQACNGGDMYGCTDLGVAYENGIGGLTKDRTRSVQLYTQACNGGDMLGCAYLGEAYEDDVGGRTENEARAVQL